MRWLICLLTLWWGGAAQAYNYAGNYTFAARWNEWGRYSSGGVVVYPEEFGNFNEYDVCPPQQTSVIFPSAVVSGNIKQTCANLWKSLIESSYILSSSSSLVRAKDLSEDWIIDYVDPNDSTNNYYFNWYANQYFGFSWAWGDPSVLRWVYPLTLSGGPHNGESVLGNGKLLAFGDKRFVMLDNDGSLSFYWYGVGGLLEYNPSTTTFSGGAFAGQTLSSKLQYLIGYEEFNLYFLVGANTLHVYNRDMTWSRTDTVSLGNELSGYSLGDLVDNKIPGYTYIGWDAGPIVIGVTALRPLDHIEVTSSSSSALAGGAVSFTLRACATADCSTLYTRGVSGYLMMSDGTNVAFSIASGSSTVSTSLTVATAPAAGYVTASLSGLTVTPIGSPSIYCGFGVTATSVASCNFAITSPLHHLAVTTSSSAGMTCTPTTFTIVACADAACTGTFSGSVSGNLTLSGTGATVKPAATNAFSISGGASSTTVSAQVTTVPATGYVTVGLSGLTMTPSASPSLYCGLGAAASAGGSCNYSVNTAGLLLSVPNHLSEASATMTVTAVKQGTSTASCVPAFASVSKSINIQCAYSNPSSGTLPVRVAGTALNAGGSVSSACDGTGANISLSFDATGMATTNVLYADVGQVSLTASYSGSGADAGLSMSGTSSFIASPASFGFSGVTASSLVAGNAFAATVTARNSAGAATPNFGKETAVTTDYVRLAWSKYRPTGSHSAAGALTGSGTTGASPYISSTGFNLGAITISDLKWSEVGTGDLSATLVSGSYLGSGSAVSGSTGSTGAVGPFVPHHFNVTRGLSCGSFVYSGQPMDALTVTAANASGGTTVNYDGTANTSPNYAKAVTLTAVGASGSLSPATINASDFTRGVATFTSATATLPTFTFSNKLTAPTSVVVRATDTSGVSSSAGSEQAMSVRSGRLRISNAFGSEKSSLAIPVQAQYWNGRAWVVNGDDSCTSIPAASVVRSNYVDSKGASTSAWSTTPSAITILAGNGTLTLSAPSANGTGSVDFALNLGSSTTDQSCLASHPSSTGAGLSWLRAQNGTTNACAGVTTYDRDPSARATFGVYSSESRKVVFTREMY
ncbi:MAG TPA: DUF6701 domain-containing protein [Aquabacterium sp.]|uniref:DUF6701 domain-containing protein n=1 Tax=Aquabacterium sp. TaxID=1872578 RepID=UPI002E34B1ED|nr:DUF6701 domain-containing protein [Aquabacterium sp.]HEX5356317.1 DUF6701 domain-containing protein [Aquabacterium sp.]